MTCQICGGRVEWQGHLTELSVSSATKCLSCGAVNCQTTELPAEQDVELWDADPYCKHNVVDADGGGVRCTKCGGWKCL